MYNCHMINADAYRKLEAQRLKNPDYCRRLYTEYKRKAEWNKEGIRFNMECWTYLKTNKTGWEPADWLEAAVKVFETTNFCSTCGTQRCPDGCCCSC